MPNPAMLALLSGFRDRMATFGQPIAIRRTANPNRVPGLVFQAIVLAVPSADPAMELGADLREKATFEVRRGFAPDLWVGDVVSQTRPFWRTQDMEDTGNFPDPLWKITAREDNPADFCVKYWAVRITGQDNQP